MSKLNSDSPTFSEISNSNMYGSDQLPWHPPNFISYLEWVEVSFTVTNVESSCHSTCSNGKTWPWCWLTQENQDQGNWEDRGTKKDQKNEKGRKAKETFEGMIFPAQTGKASKLGIKFSSNYHFEFHVRHMNHILCLHILAEKSCQKCQCLSHLNLQYC